MTNDPRRSLCRLKLGLLLISLFLGAVQGAWAEDTPVLLRPARVFTADDMVSHIGSVVLVTRNKITAVGPAASVTARRALRY